MGARSSFAQSARRALVSFLMVALLSGALYSGYLFFTTVKAVVANTSLPDIPGLSDTSAIPGRAPAHELPDVVSKKEPVNILLLGIDQREGEEGPWRSDTMILVSIDPSTNKASMLSLPRDLWVTIPGYGENRINAAHSLGDYYNYPGGGPALAKETVKEALGIPVHYYVRINFTGFEKMIDAIGGITIDVPRHIYDSAYPDNNYGTYVVEFQPGIQTMDGKRALEYARTRHDADDFDRMQRQQQVILAVRDKALSLDIPLSSIPELLRIAGDSISTDLTLREIVALAEMVKNLSTDGIRTAAVDSTMTYSVTTLKGAMVQVADWEKVHTLVNELFPNSTPLDATPDPTRSQIALEGARIELRNGSGVDSLGEQATLALRANGYNVIRYDSNSEFNQDASSIVVYTDKPYTLESLVSELGILPENIRLMSGSESDVDLIIILGKDYVPAVSQ
ncbi:MAG: LCP family protein [Chloroflexi bacterium]|nr:LCP family protein [Chloroflexota bacterium]